MNRDTRGQLEFPQVLEMLQELAQTELGCLTLSNIQPLADRTALQERLAVLSEAITLAEKEGFVPLGQLEDPRPILHRLEQSAARLEGVELLLLLGWIGAGREILERIDEDRFPHLAFPWKEVGDLTPLALEIERVIDPSGEVRDDADPELHSVRNQIRRAKQRAQEHLKKYFSGARAKHLIPDPYVTQRNNRYVIPIRLEEQGKLPGVVHATSSSGATLFMEPLEAVELNNRCIYLEERQEEIIRRLLQQLTDLVRAQLEDLKEATQLVARSDSLQACARFSARHKCILPRINSEGMLRLELARHPLLLKSLGEAEVVPITVEMNPEQPVLVISGPNTGGKTVALKTIGLLALMAQSGLPLPAAGAELPIYFQVLSDIGDRQSISASLSTFSSHVLQVREMIERLTPPALILLDELGTGTDPFYGAALGIAIIDHFKRSGAMVVATTHHQAVKQFASDTPGVVNASVELDATTMKPTYQLRMGLAGGSSALEVAEQLGLPGPLLEQARKLLDSRQLQVEKYLGRLRRELQQLDQARRSFEAQQESLEQRELELREEMEKRDRQRQKENAKALQAWSAEFSREASQRIKSITEGIERQRLRRRAEQQRQSLQEAFRRKMKSQTRETPPQTGASPTSPRPGDWVYHSFFRKKGRVVSLDQDRALVDLEGKRVESPLDQITLWQEPAGPASLPNVKLDVVVEAERQLNLIGLRVDEALSRLDKYLDRAFVAQLQEVEIIHGHGTGRLRQAVSEFLSEHVQVAKHRVQGGATVVTLRV